MISYDPHLELVLIFAGAALTLLVGDIFAFYVGIKFYYDLYCFGLPIFKVSLKLNKAVSIDKILERALHDHRLLRRVKLVPLNNSKAAIRDKSVGMVPLPPMHGVLVVDSQPEGVRLSVVGYVNVSMVLFVFSILSFFYDRGFHDFTVTLGVLTSLFIIFYRTQKEYFRIVLESIEDLFLDE